MENIEKTYEVMKKLKSIKESMHQMMQHQLKDLTLTGPQGMVVGLLTRHDSLRMSEIADKMGLSLSTVSEIIDRLEKMDAVKRMKSPEDGRVVLVELTEEFRKESAGKFKEVESIWLKKIEMASEDELQKIIDGLEALDKLLGKE
ncbi:MAG: MarR family transcriptional regulator [Clostridiales bacterium]|jgi:DNA-binding MarR family transcriptional regulator|nr:MarR family transcriptional regulator [Clostridiales bacterium]